MNESQSIKILPYVYEQISAGTLPLTFGLSYRCNLSKLLRFANDAGISPERLLSFKYNSVSCIKFPSVDGMVPDKELSDNANDQKFCNFPNSDGIVSVTPLLLPMYKYLN